MTGKRWSLQPPFHPWLPHTYDGKDGAGRGRNHREKRWTGRVWKKRSELQLKHGVINCQKIRDWPPPIISSLLKIFSPYCSWPRPAVYPIPRPFSPLLTHVDVPINPLVPLHQPITIPRNPLPFAHQTWITSESCQSTIRQVTRSGIP